MKWFFLFVLLLSGCHEPRFDAKTSVSSPKRCPVSLTPLQECIEDELNDFVDKYSGKKDRERVQAELTAELLSKRVFQTCGKETGLLEKLEVLDAGEEKLCKNADLMGSFLDFIDQLTLRLALRIVRKNR